MSQHNLITGDAESENKRHKALDDDNCYFHF